MIIAEIDVRVAFAEFKGIAWINCNRKFPTLKQRQIGMKF